MAGKDGVLRIALVGHKCLPADYGGVEVAAEEIGARLAALGHEVISFTSSPRPPSGVHRGIDCRKVGRLDGKHVGALTQAFTATVAAVRTKPDVVHFQAMGPSMFAPVVRLMSRATVVVTIQGRDDQRRKWSALARRLISLSYFTGTRFSHGVIGVSEHLAAELSRVTRGQCIHIPNGVPRPPTEQLTPTDVDPAVGDRPFVLFAGRLVPEKRPDALIRAFLTLDTDVDLVIAGGSVGDPEYAASLRIAAVDGRIRFLGHRSRAEVDALMRGAAVFVLPSELEGLPIALLEALGSGAPVVVSDLPCHREVLGDGGPGARIVPVHDDAALADAIAAVLAHPNARADAAERKVDVTHRYDWDRVTEQSEAFYRALQRR